jgi:hypothetical protein
MKTMYVKNNLVHYKKTIPLIKYEKCKKKQKEKKKKKKVIVE